MAKGKRKKGNLFGKAPGKVVKHPGIEKARAKRNGISTHAQLEKDAHSSNPTRKKQGELGLRFEGYHGGLKGRVKSNKKTASHIVRKKDTRRYGPKRTRKEAGKR